MDNNINRNNNNINNNNINRNNNNINNNNNGVNKNNKNQQNYYYYFRYYCCYIKALSMLTITREQVEEQASTSHINVINGNNNGGSGGQSSGLGIPCECHAWHYVPNRHHQPITTTRSKVGVVYAANIRKRFEGEPFSTSGEIGSSAVLHCLPPIGQPTPKVYWIKDGVDLDIDSDTNLIQTSEGSLIISQLRIHDNGNYTCAAYNMAGKRLSDVATLRVIVNGGWTAWSSWSECLECSQHRHQHYQRRSRTCANPQPQNGGNFCKGEKQQKQPCQISCPDGSWSQWSGWSACSNECKQHRSRSCSGDEDDDDDAAINRNNNDGDDYDGDGDDDGGGVVGRGCVGERVEVVDCPRPLCKDVQDDLNDVF
ncbi:hypothetical protein HELRODRAFT_174767 [Helobdella robusta]|uniref:Ig-like domain-containing protein n=1 Tax=Helobdella robusta TaxID=6412 RepID=T1F8F9_HELRO|nr:hypothetical protein HELRODRAFT_174767 [Helobdella robusta]ESO01222.1 hypothetical protein HELRODRAFT_174767 [Helobdella robusta]